jgi:glycolate oxidase FAD binding subunit
MTITTERRAEPRWAEVESIVGAACFRAASTGDSVDGVTPTVVVYPEASEQVSEILKWAVAEDVAIAVRGGGSKMGWGNVPHPVGLILSTERMAGVVEHNWEDMTFSVKAGTTIAALQSQLGKHRQRLALDPLWPERSTVGGVIATNDSGALRLRYGSMRDLILGVTIVLANGTIARSGGKVVKNVAGYDLPKLLVGSYGTLAVIAEATFRAHPQPHAVRTLSFEFADPNAANHYTLAITDTALVPTGLQVSYATGGRPKVDIRFEGVPIGIEAQAKQAIVLAGDAQHSVPAANCWSAGESLWEGDSQAAIGKFSVLPTRIASAIQLFSRHFAGVRTIVQSTGLGLFRVEYESAEKLISAIRDLHAAFQTGGGTMTLLQLPLEIKRQMDIFGPARDSYPLMVRVKQQFDSRGTLNPGRFVGGI